jgi:tRNA-dihydrouridine synthase
MADTTGCAGVMIGRAALVRPWLFWEFVHRRPWPGNPLDVLDRMASLTETLSPPELRTKRFLRFCSWFLRNWPFHHHLFKQAAGLDSIPSIMATLMQELAEGQVTLLKEPLYHRL